MGRIHVFAAVELLLGENRPVMGEGQEAFLAVIVPHTGITNPAERQVVLGHVHQGIIDAHAAGMGVVHHMLLVGLVIAKEIQRQRPWPVIDVMDRLVQTAVTDDRQDRAENLVLHHLHVRRGLQHQCQRNLPGTVLHVLVGGIDLHQFSPLGPGIFQIALQTIVLALIDDGRVVVVIPQAGVHLGEPRPEFIHERLHPVGRAEHIVRCHAGLASIEGFAEGDTLGRIFHRHIRRNNGRGFAAELKGYRGQVFGCRAHHQLAHRSRTGKQQVIERPLGEIGRHIGLASDHRHQILREHRLDDLLEQGRRVRSEFRHLDHGAVASRQGSDQWTDRQIQRVIPGHDDAYNPFGLVVNLVAGGLEQNRNMAFGGLHPVAEILQRVIDALNRRHDFGNQGFVFGATAEIPIDGLDQAILMGQ